jgi:hypothetical protein
MLPAHTLQVTIPAAAYDGWDATTIFRDLRNAAGQHRRAATRLVDDGQTFKGASRPAATSSGGHATRLAAAVPLRLFGA